MVQATVLWPRQQFCSPGSSSSAQVAVLWPRQQFCGPDSSSVAQITILWPRCALFPIYFHTYFSERSWVPFWLILDGLWMNFDGFGYHFYLIVYKFLATILQTTKAACPDDIGHTIRGQLPTTPLGAPFSQYQKLTNAANETPNFTLCSPQRCQ